MFQPYESKPIIRMAVQITTVMQYDIEKVGGEESSWIWYVTGTGIPERISFKAYEVPRVGDWIVRLTESDTYHVTDEVFRERNIVPEVPAKQIPQATELRLRTKSA